MPSPFPGMDPYLEGSLWTSVHTQLGVEIQRQLMPLLRPRYIALTNERFVIATAEDEEPGAVIYPDLAVADLPSATAWSASADAAPAPMLATTVMPRTHSQISVEIRDAGERKLVTDIEILSTASKLYEGRAEYIARRNRLLLSPAHLMEIDLLRIGKRVPMRKPLPDQPYFVLVSRVERRPVTEIWPVSLDMPLPTVPVPLLAGDADVMLDLQRAFSNVYDLAGYELAVDYSRPPEQPLSPADAAWAKARLESWAGGAG